MVVSCSLEAALESFKACFGIRFELFYVPVAMFSFHFLATSFKACFNSYRSLHCTRVSPFLVKVRLIFSQDSWCRNPLAGLCITWIFIHYCFKISRWPKNLGGSHALSQSQHKQKKEPPISRIT